MKSRSSILLLLEKHNSENMGYLLNCEREIVGELDFLQRAQALLIYLIFKKNYQNWKDTFFRETKI